MSTDDTAPERIRLTIDHYTTGTPQYYLLNSTNRKMSGQGLFVILLIIIATLVETTGAFGGRRKHVAHIFGKRAEYDISNPQTNGRTFGFGPNNPGLQNMDYYTSQDRKQQSVVFPTDEKVQGNFDYLNSGDYNEKEQSGLFDMPNDDNDQDYSEENLRQKFLNLFFFDRLPRYRK